MTITTRPRTAFSSETLPRNRRPRRSSSSGICCSMTWRDSADHAEPAARGADQGAVAEQVGIEVALPVVPELAGVGLERRHGDPGAGQRRLGLARVEVGRPVDVDEHRARDAEVGEHASATRVAERRRRDASRRSGSSASVAPAGSADRGLRRVRGLGEGVDHLARRGRVRVGEVEGAPSRSVEVGDVVHRLDDEVDRDDVDLAALDARHRHPLRDRVADPADQLEEVVGAVDLVHLAGLASRRRRSRAGRPATAARTRCARRPRTRAWCGSRGGCRGPGPPRTCPRARCPGRARRRRSS